jgi:hypothetical protein
VLNSSVGSKLLSLLFGFAFRFSQSCLCLFSAFCLCLLQMLRLPQSCALVHDLPSFTGLDHLRRSVSISILRHRLVPVVLFVKPIVGICQTLVLYAAEDSVYSILSEILESSFRTLVSPSNGWCLFSVNCVLSSSERELNLKTYSSVVFRRVSISNFLAERGEKCHPFRSLTYKITSRFQSPHQCPCQPLQRC